MKPLKPSLSIGHIGATRFWIALIVGECFAITFCLLFSYAAESFRMFTYLSDLIILSKKELLAYRVFYGLLSTSLAFGITISIWLQGRNNNVKKRHLAKLAASNAWMMVFVVLMVAVRLTSTIIILVKGRGGSVKDISMLIDFWILLVLLPIYIFYSHWNVVRLVFKAGRWLNIAAVIFVVNSLLLAFCISANHDFLTLNFEKDHTFEYGFIDKELGELKEVSPNYDPIVRKLLRHDNYVEDIDLFMDKIFAAVCSENATSIDTLFYLKISIHILKRPYYRDEDWSYVSPWCIFRQIKLQEMNTIEMRTLFEILREHILVVNAVNPEKISRYGINLSFTGRKRLSYHLALSKHTNIYKELPIVIDTLLHDNKYLQYHDILLLSAKDTASELEINTYGDTIMWSK